MGAYYKTSDPQDTDFIMSSPTSLMQQALQETSDQDDQQIKSLDLFGNAIANVHHLPGQEATVKAIQQGYQSQIDDATNQIMKDPANYQKHMPLIRGIQRTLSSDLQNGQLAYYNNTADQYNSQIGSAQNLLFGKDGKPGAVTPEQVQAYKSYLLKDYNDRIKANSGKAYDPQTGASIPLSSEGLYATPDIQTKMKSIEDGIKANSGKYSKDNITGKWIFKGTQSDEQVEAARVADLVWNSLQSDSEVMGWARQGQKMGYLNGVAYPSGTKSPGGTDMSGQLIQPYSIDSKGNPVFNQASMFSPMIKSAIDKEAYKKIENLQETKVNEYGIKSYEGQIALNNMTQKAAVDHAYKQADERTAATVKQQLDDHNAIMKTALGSSSSYQKVYDMVMGNGLTHITASPDGTTTISPFAGADKDVNGNPKPINSSVINNVLLPASNSKLADLALKMKDNTLTDNQRALYTQQYNEENTNNDFLKDASNRATTAAQADLIKSKKFTADDLNNYYNYQRPEVQSAFKQQQQEISQQIGNLINPEYQKAIDRGAKGGIPSSIPMYTDPTKAKELLLHLQNINKQADRFSQIGQAMDDSQAKWFKDNASSANQTLKGVGLSVPAKQMIYEQLKVNPEVDIRNLNLDASGGSLADKAKTILQNVVKSGENLSDYFDIERINAPVKGVGVTATIKLKNPMETTGNPVGNIWRSLTGENVAGKNINTSDFGKSLLMTLPSSVLNSLGTALKTNGENEIQKNLGEIITNKSESDLLGSLKQRFVSQTPDGHTGPIGTASYYEPTSKQQLGITVVPQTTPGGGNTTYKGYVKDSQGNNHLFSTTINPTGEYASEEAFVQALLGTTQK